MQCLYAITLSRDESLDNQKKFLKESIANTYTLYLLVLSLLIELYKREKNVLKLSSKKYIPTEDDAVVDPKRFLNNRVLGQLANNEDLLDLLENKKLNQWDIHEDYVKIVYNAIKESDLFKDYMALPEVDYEKDKRFIVQLFKEVIAPNEKIYEYFEDDRLTWVDDIPLINTFVLKSLKNIKANADSSYFLPELLKDKEDILYAEDLLVKTLVNNKEFEQEIQRKTPNWDKDRIAEIDGILLKMAICELLHFPSIPERVTINEYLEIAKEYSTPKSSIFINGILDKMVKEFQQSGKLKKMGRGLL